LIGALMWMQRTEAGDPTAHTRLDSPGDGAGAAMISACAENSGTWGRNRCQRRHGGVPDEVYDARKANRRLKLADQVPAQA
jgi:hypothetical protein